MPVSGEVLQSGLRGLLVFVVDDEAGIRDEIGETLALAGADTIGFASGAALLAELPHLPTGIVILDLGLPGISGLDVLAALKSKDLPHRVIVLTGNGSVTAAVTAMQSGARDFIEKPVTPEALLRAVRAAAADLAGVLADRARRDDAVRRIASLSARERDVLEGLLSGLQNKAIAIDLGLSVRTIEMHRQNLMHKLGARTAAHAMALALLATGNRSQANGALGTA